MPEKNPMGWPSGDARLAVGHAVDIDPQHFFNVVTAYAPDDVKAKIYADMFPPVTQAAIVEDIVGLQSDRAILEKYSASTDDIDAKIAALAAVTGESNQI